MDILSIIKRYWSGGAFICLFLITRFPRIYTFEYTEPTEISQRDLELLNSLCPGDEVLGVTGSPLLLDPHSVDYLR